MHRIEAELLIPGHGGPIRDGVVVLEGSRIGYAGPAGAAPREWTASPGAPVTRAAAVMPGMWECHGHLLGTRTFDLAQLPLEPEALRAARCTRDLRAALDAGITSVRDVGGLGVHLARAVAEGLVDGPAIYGAGAILSTTGGHADLHSFPLDWMQDFSRREGLMRLAHGPDDCARAVREQLRRNAKLIKVCASGGVLSEVDDPIHQQFTAAELRAIVEVAGLADRVVAAHCHGKPGIMAALRAGVRTIEHGTFLDDEAMRMMKERGTFYVPTMMAAEGLKQSLTDGYLPPVIEKKARLAMASLHETVTKAVAMGLKIALGTDAAVYPHGKNAGEFEQLVSCGMKPVNALKAGTSVDAELLGVAGQTGSLEMGKSADVVAVPGNPEDDIRQTQKVMFVMKQGVVYRNDKK